MDIHINLVPGTPPVPTPLPHVYTGMILDPFDYLPIFGQTVMVNRIPAAQPMTECMFFPQFPIAGPFTKPPEMKGEVVTGSNTVGSATMSLTQMAVMGGAWVASKLGIPTPEPPQPTPPTSVYPYSRLGDIALGCADVGPPAPTGKDKKGGVKGLTFVAGVVMAVPLGFPVMASGPPAPAPLSAFVLRFAMQFAMKKLVKFLGKAARKVATFINKKILKKMAKEGNLAQRVSNRMCKMGLEPIDLASGKMTTERNDFSLPGPVPLEWDCVYYTSSDYLGPVGYGWHHKYDMALTPEMRDGYLVMKLRLADGRLAFFPQLEVGEAFLDRQEKLELRRDEQGYYLRDEKRFLYRFHEGVGDDWPLARVEDTSGNKIQFNYDGHLALREVVDSAGRHLQVDTDAFGHIIAIHAPHPEKEGATFPIVRYEYDEAGRLLAAINALGHAFRYRYEGLLMVQLTYRDGLSFYYEYDSDGHDAKCTHSHGDGNIYNGNLAYEEGKTTLERIVGHPDGHVEHFIETYYHDGAVVHREIDALGNEKRFEYSEDYELLAEIDPLGHKTSYKYDNRGNLIQISYPDDTKIKMRYSEEDLLVEAVDQIGGKWVWEYDERGRVVKRVDSMERATEYRYNENGQLIQLIDPAGGRTLIGYNARKEIDQLTTPDNASSRWRYDNLGRGIASIDPKGNTQRRIFDLLGQVVRVEEPDGNLRKLAYDAQGKIIHIKDNQRDIRFEFEGLGEIKKRIENNTVLTLKYNTVEQLVGIVNEHGHAYKFDLDANGKVELESGFDEVKRFYQRDAAGRVTKVTRASGIESSYDYDAMGRILECRHSNGEIEKYAYREDGEVISAINQNGSVVFERDPMGRATIEDQNGFWVQSRYDLLGFRTQVSTSLGLDLIISRNKMGDVLSLKTQGNVYSWEMEFKRDILGLEVERLFSSGVRGKWERDQLGRPVLHKVFSKGGEIQRSRAYEWDVNYRLKRFVDLGTEVTHFQHDSFGNLSATIYPDGKSEYRLPDAVGNLFRKPDRSDRKYGPAGQLLEAEGTHYRYDLEGNLIEKNTSDGKTWRYRWNAAGMLSKVIRPDEETVYFTYDALGRRISKKFKGTITYWVWDGNVPIHEWTSSRRDSEVHSISTGLPLEENYEQNWKEDEIVFFDKDDDGTEPETILIREAQPKYADTAILTEGQAIPLPTSNSLITWLFEPEAFAPIGKLSGEKQYSIQTDHLGTPVSMYDGDGKRIWTASLNSYGKLNLAVGDAQVCPFRYPGQYEDVETGLYYNRFRYYDPDMKEYVSQDPIGIDGNTRNFYSYAQDLNKEVDEYGLSHSTSSTLLHNIIQQSSFGSNKVELPGSHSYDDIMEAGRKFVGPNARIETFPDGKIKAMYSSDGLKRFRPPQYKPLQGYRQANFEMRTNTNVSWNSHIFIDDGKTKIENPHKSNMHVKCP
ncbi:MAG: RHS repeat protein [Lewinellaceae bacterium]|nr:RHS repeat protein [Lewinellaceae bacterium]